MWRNAITATFVAAAALLVLPSASLANFQQGDWEFTLAGSGASDNDFDANGINASASLGYFVSDQLELSVRQGLGIFDTGDDSAWSGITRVAADFHFDLGEWQPFVGAQFGGTYGDDVNETFLAGPEGGVKYFVNSTTFIFATVEYQFFFDDAGDADDAFDDGQWVYGLGIGFRF